MTRNLFKFSTEYAICIIAIYTIFVMKDYYCSALASGILIGANRCYTVGHLPFFTVGNTKQVAKLGQTFVAKCTLVSHLPCAITLRNVVLQLGERAVTSSAVSGSCHTKAVTYCSSVYTTGVRRHACTFCKLYRTIKFICVSYTFYRHRSILYAYSQLLLVSTTY
jgi:hypothetical protein